MKIDKDKIWTFGIVVIMFLYLLLMSIFSTNSR